MSLTMRLLTKIKVMVSEEFRVRIENQQTTLISDYSARAASDLPQAAALGPAATGSSQGASGHDITQP